MSLEQTVGATYGPLPMRISPEKVAEYVEATGDLPERWENYAPPSVAGALLFAVAPQFLDDPRVRPFTGVLVHVDQAFTWHGPLGIDTAITVTGRVEKVRERGGRFFVTFVAEVETQDGDRLLDAVSTFLMGEAVTPKESDDPGEPPVWQREINEFPTPRPRPGVGEPFHPINKSASRLDLVKYAAASGDYNPIHFDHDAARAAGLSGIVVHGLMMSAWATQAVAQLSNRPDPIAHMKFRYRNPLRPGASAQVTGFIGDMAADEADCQVGVKVLAGEELLVGVTGVARLDG